MQLLSISFDDVDSRFWGCTTHLAGLFLVELSKSPKYQLADYPLLVRLNPAIPWKTRGNAAVVIRLAVAGEDASRSACELAASLVEEYTKPRLGEPVKKPGIACAGGKPWEAAHLQLLYRRALTDIVTPDLADKAAERAGVKLRGGRGRIGAAASLAALGPGDPYTFELTAYRHPDAWGEERCILHGLAPRVEASLPPCTFNNYDAHSGKVAAAPGGPDPVLAGFRGTCPGYLTAYAKLLCEKPHFWVLYRSNQHTDPHAHALGAPRPYKTGLLEGTIYSTPEITPGGHVVVGVRTDNGHVIDAAFYRETGPLNRAARLLAPGDRVRLLASVRPYHPRGRAVVTVEKMTVLELTPRFIMVAPRCPKCGHRMKRMGSRGGYKCPKCGYRDPNAAPVRLWSPRSLAPGVYTPWPGRLRHLTAPSPPPPQPPKLELPILLDWRIVLSTNSNPPVSDPLVSGGAHQHS